MTNKTHPTTKTDAQRAIAILVDAFKMLHDAIDDSAEAIESIGMSSGDVKEFARESFIVVFEQFASSFISNTASAQYKKEQKK